MNLRNDWSKMPLGLVSKPYLSRVTGISAHTIGKAMMSRQKPCVLSKFDALHCGEAAFAFAPWVTAWSLDRVLSWLDQYDPDGARILRDGVGADAEAVRAEVHGRRLQRTREWFANQTEDKRRERVRQAVDAKRRKRGPSPMRLEIARKSALLATMPVGLLPATTIAKAADVDYQFVARYMAANEIAPYSERRNAGFPNVYGAWNKLIDAWGPERSRSWVAEFLPDFLDRFDRRAERGSVRQRYVIALRGAPLGCLPDGVVGVAYDVPAYQVAKIRASMGAPRFSGVTAGRFPSAPGSFRRLVAHLGQDRARLWVAGFAPKYLEAFDLDTAPKRAATTAPAPVAAGGTSSRPAATGAVSAQCGEVMRATIARSVTLADGKRTEASSIERDAAAMRRTQVTPAEKSAREPAGPVETFEEFLARGGRVTKLVGAGNPGVGRVVAL